MVFFETVLANAGGHRLLQSTLFPAPVAIAGDAPAGQTVTLGVRPEHIQVSASPLSGGAPAQLLRKTVQIGGQYLLALAVDGLREQGFKAKVAPSAGERLPERGQVFVEIPLEAVSLFDDAGVRIPAMLQLAKAPVAAT
jgi:hypothetical protein